MDSDGRIELIRGLCSFDGRRAGTDAERRAANWLAKRLRAQGRRAEVEPTYVHPQYGLVHAVHCALGFAGSLLAVAVPVAGFVLVLAAATSMYLDLNGRLHLVRSLFFRRASQNVVSPGPRPEAPLRLVLCAHYDAARTGAAFAPRKASAARLLARRLPVPVGAFRVLFWSLALLVPLLGARVAGADFAALGIVQLVPTIILLVGAFALAEIELSPIVPGANDNASGVATVLSLADELDREPPQSLDVWVLLTGAEECLQEGMRAYLRAHRRELDRERIAFLCIDAVGFGDVRYETSAGWAVSYYLDRGLISLADAVAAADRDADDRYRAGPVARGTAGDSLPPRLRRYRSLGIGCAGEDGNVPDRRLPSDTSDRIDPSAVERAHGFALDLIRLLDRDATRRASAGAPAGPSR
ncbi:MAG TPA: M28 family peptidase [Solirubrobacterales bacterium]|nr:M28 family peptidase [Solirubrobacterales bacterium]